MSETVNIDLSDRERDLVLTGLRYVRSSVLLDMRMPTPDDRTERDQQLDEIERIVHRLSGVESRRAVEV